MSINGVVKGPVACDLPRDASGQGTVTPLREQLEREAGRVSQRLPRQTRKSERQKKQQDLDSPVGVNAAERWNDPAHFRLLREGLQRGEAGVERAPPQHNAGCADAVTKADPLGAALPFGEDQIFSLGETPAGGGPLAAKSAPTSTAWNIGPTTDVNGKRTPVTIDPANTEDSVSSDFEPAIQPSSDLDAGLNAAPQVVQGLLGTGAIALAVAATSQPAMAASQGMSDGTTPQDSPHGATGSTPGQGAEVTFAFGSWSGGGHAVVAQWMAASSSWLLHAQSERVRQALLHRIDSTTLEGVKVAAVTDDAPGKRRRRESGGERS